MAIKLSVDLDRVVLFAPPRLQLPTTTNELRSIVRALFQHDLRDIICDFSECEYIDSSGLGELVSSLTYFRHGGGSFAINRLNPRVRELLTVNRLLTVFTTYSVDYSAKRVVPVSGGGLDASAARLLQGQVSAFTLLLAVRNGRIKVMASQREGIVKVTVGDQRDYSPASALHLIADVKRSYLCKEIEEFEEVINAKEPNLREFLERHIQFLPGPQYHVHPEIVFERNAVGPSNPDFLLQPLDRTFCDLAHLRVSDLAPDAPKRRREDLVATLAEQIALLRVYGDYLEEPARRESLIEKFGSAAYRPRCAVIIDRRQDMERALYQQVQDGTAEIEVVSNDELIDRAEHHYADSTTGLHQRTSA